MTPFPPSNRGRPGVGLETWLARTIQTGALKEFPPYYPLRGTVGQRPDSYARRLLAGLRDPDLSAWDREELCDDGRAFRGWAEAPRALSATPRAGKRLLSPSLGS